MATTLPLPPHDLRFMGRSDEEFLGVGDTVAAELAEFTSLQPTDTVLEIGAGYGRVAHALWRRGHRGRFAGMDILARHIQWCSDQITPATDGVYTFHHLDVRNDRYNPNGTLEPTEVSLDVGVRPDVVLVASVFTHMYADPIVHYLREIRSMLAEGGRVMATFFLMNDSQRAAEAAGRSRHPLRYEVSEFARCWDVDNPLHVIAHDQGWVHRQAKLAGLEVRAVHLGSWCGRIGGAVYQDTLILTPTH